MWWKTPAVPAYTSRRSGQQVMKGGLDRAGGFGDGLVEYKGELFCRLESFPARSR